MRLIFSLAIVVTAIPLDFAQAADTAPSEECSERCIEYSGIFELNGAWLFPGDAATPNSYLAGIKAESEFAIKFIDGLSVVGNIVTEPVIDAEPGVNQIFTGAGSYIDVLQVQYDTGDFSVWGGKIHPAFGRAWDVTPGLHGTDLAENYELAERLGAGAGYSFEGAGFANRLQANIFTVDRTLLSESIFNNRGRASLDDGGAGNTDGFSSIAAALEGCIGAEPESCYDEGSFGYQLAARYQLGGSTGDGNELGLVASLNKAISLSEDTTIRLFGEFGWFRNYEASADNAVVMTVSGALETGPMTYSLAYAQQRILVVGEADDSEQLFDATAMYALSDTVTIAGEKWSLGAGYTWARADEEDSHAIGLRLSSEFAGWIPLGY
jgi:hypothetical protein